METVIKEMPGQNMNMFGRMSFNDRSSNLAKQNILIDSRHFDCEVFKDNFPNTIIKVKALVSSFILLIFIISFN